MKIHGKRSFSILFLKFAGVVFVDDGTFDALSQRFKMTGTSFTQEDFHKLIKTGIKVTE